MQSGVVYLVGAGPGDPGLITVRGRECLRSADVILVDHLVNPALLDEARQGAEVLTRPPRRAGLEQEEINRVLVEKARAGKTVVRLKGGDPFVFGRGGEEAEVLAAAGVRFEVVPGVTAAVAAPAYAGIPLTHRGAAGAVAFATGHEADRKEGGTVDWEALSRGASTLVLYMSVTHLAGVVARLLAAGRPASEPVAVVERGTWPEQRTVAGTLADIVERVRAAGVAPPALTIVGEVVRMQARLDWFTRRILLLSTKGESDLGGDVVRIAPLTVRLLATELRAVLARRERFRTLAFTSAHAVDATWEALAAGGLDARALAGRSLAVVGRATAERLLARGLRADCVGEAGGAELARAMVGGCCEGPVLVLRAQLGRDELGDGLVAAGFSVEIADAYATHPDAVAIARALELHRSRPFEAVAFTSPRGVAAFLDGGAASLEHLIVGAIGATTARALAERSVHVDVVPPEPDLSALLAGVRACLAARAP